jgi:hypothetical protein
LDLNHCITHVDRLEQGNRIQSISHQKMKRAKQKGKALLLRLEH